MHSRRPLTAPAAGRHAATEGGRARGGGATGAPAPASARSVASALASSRRQIRLSRRRGGRRSWPPLSAPSQRSSTRCPGRTPQSARPGSRRRLARARAQLDACACWGARMPCLQAETTLGLTSTQHVRKSWLVRRQNACGIVGRTCLRPHAFWLWMDSLPVANGDGQGKTKATGPPARADSRGAPRPSAPRPRM